MKSLRQLLALALVLGAIAIPASAQRGARSGYSETSVRGRWIWSYSGQLASRYKFASIGFARFDGAGKCSLALRENSGVNGGYPHSSTSCEYEVGKDGRGQATFSLDGEAGAIEFVVSPGRISFVAPEEATIANGEMVRMGDPSAGAYAGSWALSLEGTRYGESVSGIGTLKVSRSGKCSGTLLFSDGVSKGSKTSSCQLSIMEGFADIDVTYSDGSSRDMFMVVGSGGRGYTLTKARGEVVTGEAFRR